MKTPRSHTSLAWGLVFLAVSMGALAYASVPLYELFCRTTGFGGKAQATTVTPPAQAGERTITVRFDANVSPGLDWSFVPSRTALTVKVGEKAHVTYTAKNRAATAATGTATFNVTPVKAGSYFQKIQCFCFVEQRLGPQESKDMDVVFFVDPAIGDNPDLDDVHTITLSYTFFRVEPK